MSFNQFNLNTRLLKSVEKAGYAAPTAIQTEAMPVILAGKDVIGTSQTGTGKTAAFVLPILNRLIDAPRHKTQAMIVTPTRELAEQIHEAICQLGEHTTVRSATIYGGVSPKNQIRALKSGVEILVVCPGRLLDLTEQGFGDFSALQTLVLDEADRMLDMGFFPHVRRILKMLPAKRQTLLFSATFPQEVEELAAETLREPQRVALALAKPVHTVSHALYPVAQHLKTPLLLELLKQTDARSVLIFTRTKHRAQRLSDKIGRTGYRVTSLHGDRSQSQRQSALKGFKQGDFQIMVATDIAARGLDVERISHVINYDMPGTPDDYIHRIGRTGRAERTGDAYTLTTPEDASMVRTLEKIIGKPLLRQKLSDFDYSAAAVTFEKSDDFRPRFERERYDRPTARPRAEARADERRAPRPRLDGDKRERRSDRPKFEGERDEKPTPRKRFDGENKERRNDRPRFDDEKRERRAPRAASGEESRTPRKRFDGEKNERRSAGNSFEGERGERRPFRSKFDGDKNERPAPRASYGDETRARFGSKFEESGERRSSRRGAGADRKKGADRRVEEPTENKPRRWYDKFLPAHTR